MLWQQCFNQFNDMIWILAIEEGVIPLIILIKNKIGQNEYDIRPSKRPFKRQYRKVLPEKKIIKR